MGADFFVAQICLAAFALHSFVIGYALSRRLRLAEAYSADSENTYLVFFFALAGGLALNIAIVFVSGLAGMLNAAALLAVGGFTAAVALFSLRGQAPPRVWLQDLAIIAALYAIVLSFAATAPDWTDDTGYHLPLARFYAQQGRIELYPYVRFPLFPENMEMLFTLAFVLKPGAVMFAEGMALLPPFATTLGLMGAALWVKNSRGLGVAASLLYLGMAGVGDLLGYAYIDNGLAMFCWAATLGAILVRADAPLSAFAFIGLLVGTAAGCKIFGLVCGALVFFVLAIRTRRVASLSAFAASTAIFGLGWYIRSFIISGDPIHPVGGPLFGYYLWNAQDYAAQQAEQASFGLFTHIWNLPYALAKGRILLALPALAAPLVLRDKRAPLLALWGVFIAYSLFWFYATQVSRYLAPVHAAAVLLAALTVWDLIADLAAGKTALGNYLTTILASRAAMLALALTLVVVALGAERRLTPVHAAATLLAVLAVYAPIARLAAGRTALGDHLATILAGSRVAMLALALALVVVALGAERRLTLWDETLRQRPGYIMFNRANGLIPEYGRRIVDVGYEGENYFFDGVAIGGLWGVGRYSEMMTPEGRLVSASQMRDILRRFEARLLAVDRTVADFDEDDYRRLFDIVFIDPNSALMKLKSDNGKSSP